MRIYVCVKHVPDTAASITVGADGHIDENITFIMNPYDENAVEAAVRLKRQAPGSEVIAVTLGRDSAVATLRSALAMGADRAILVPSNEYDDGIATARLLCRAIRRDGRADIVFTGKESIDAEGFQTMYRLGACLDMPVASNVVAFELDGGVARVTCELEAGDREVLEMPLPCVIGAGKDLNRPSYPKLPDILKAKTKPIEVTARDRLQDLSPAPRAALVSLATSSEERRPKPIEGSPQEIAAAIVHILKEEAKVID